MYNNGDYYYWGMHIFWWLLWIFIVFWILLTPDYIPGKRMKKDSPFGILQMRLASGQITIEEYKEKKKILEDDLVLRK